VYFFEEFDARFNLVAFDYLAYPAEVFTDIWEAYPVVQVLLVAVALAAVLTWSLRRRLLPGRVRAPTLRQRFAPFAVHAAALLAAIRVVPDQRVVLVVESGRKRNPAERPQQLLSCRGDQRDQLSRLLCVARSREQPQVARSALEAGGGRLTACPKAARPSFRACGRPRPPQTSSSSRASRSARPSAACTGRSGDLTPNFDAYAQRGVWFANTYASGTRTVRGLEALTASFPPIPTVSIVRRPGNDGIARGGA